MAARKKTFALAVLIVVVSCGVYVNALFNGFVYDDIPQVVENPWITDIRHLPDMFSKPVWGFQEEFSANYYRPLMHVIFMIEYHIFGLRPWGFHLVNVLFHAGVSVLVYLIVAGLLGENQVKVKIEVKEDRSSPLASYSASTFISPPFIAALLFATHPIHTEAVTWVSGLPEVSFAFFCLLSFYFWMRHREEQCAKSIKCDAADSRSLPCAPYSARFGFYALSLASFFFSVFLKETALTLPVILFAYDRLFCRQPASSPSKGASKGGYHLRRYAPYLAVAGLYFVMRLHALNEFAPFNVHKDLDAFQIVMNIFPLFSRYLEKLFLPANLNAFHVFHPVRSITETETIVSLLIAALFLAAAHHSFKKDRSVFFGLLLIVLPLLPAFYIPGLGRNAFTERYLYLPSVGFCFLMAYLLGLAAQKNPRASGGFTLGVAAILLLYSIGTVSRNADWKDEIVLFEDTARKSPDGVLPHLGLGDALLDKGMVDRAVEQYRIALTLDPDNRIAHNNLGAAFLKQGLKGPAAEQFRMALELDPLYVDALINLGKAYLEMEEAGRAIGYLETAVSLLPNDAENRYLLGVAYAENNMVEKAVEQFHASLRLRQDFAKAHVSLGRVYVQMKQLDEAIAALKAAASLEPKNSDYRNILGVLYGQKGLYDDAIEQFETALQLAPDIAAYRRNLEKAKGMKSKK